MKQSNFILLKLVHIIGYCIVVLAIGLLIREVIHFFSLPSASEPRFGIDYLKYKENTYSQSYLWILLLLFGYGVIKKNTLGWIIPQSFLLMGIVPFGVFLFMVDSIMDQLFIIIGLIYLIISILIFRLFYSEKVRLFFRVVKTRVKYYYLIIALLGSIYWIIDMFILGLL